MTARTTEVPALLPADAGAREIVHKPSLDLGLVPASASAALISDAHIFTIPNIAGGTGGAGGSAQQQGGTGGAGQGPQFTVHAMNAVFGAHNHLQSEAAATNGDVSRPAQDTEDPVLVPSLTPVSSTSQMFPSSTGLKIDRSQLMNVQENVHIHPPPSPPDITAAIHEAVTQLQTAVTTYTPKNEPANYCIQMQAQGRGFPLYMPAPQERLPQQYQARGVGIGDVGRVTPDGVFDFFFNIFLDKDHPINYNRVPSDFVPCSTECLEHVTKYGNDAGDCLFTSSITDHATPEATFPGGKFVFQCHGSQGAILALPQETTVKKLENLQVIKDYAKKHGQSWYKFIKGPAYGRQLQNGSLLLVTGHENTSSWGIASYNHQEVVLDHNLAFQPIEEAISSETDWKYRWLRLALVRRKQADMSMDDNGNYLNNQTIFIHAFTISVGTSLWSFLTQNVDVKELVDSEGNSNAGTPLSATGRFPPSLSPSTSSSYFSGPSSASSLKDSITTFELALIPEIFNPSKYINDILLKMLDSISIVITHSNAWQNILCSTPQDELSHSKAQENIITQDIASDFDYDFPLWDTQLENELQFSYQPKDDTWAHPFGDATLGTKPQSPAEDTGEDKIKEILESLTAAPDLDSWHPESELSTPVYDDDPFTAPPDYTFDELMLGSPIDEFFLPVEIEAINQGSIQVSSLGVPAVSTGPRILEMSTVPTIQENIFASPYIGRDLYAFPTDYSEMSTNTSYSAASHKAGTFICELCSKNFKLKSHLLAHLKRHGHTKEYQCEKCGTIFGTSQVLKRHSKTCPGAGNEAGPSSRTIEDMRMGEEDVMVDND